jgi:hypothetical protein
MKVETSLVQREEWRASVLEARGAVAGSGDGEEEEEEEEAELLLEGMAGSVVETRKTEWSRGDQPSSILLRSQFH